MDIRYSKNTERPVAEIVKEHFSLTINKPAGEYDRNLTDIQLYAGDVYKVKHNGSEYTCTAWAEDGEVHIGGESEPFDIYNFAGDIYVKAETDGANTFEVHHEKVNSLPYEAMPAGYPGTKTEMVEIVPEQSVTKTSSWDDVHQNEMRDFVIDVNGDSNYLVKINGNDYKCKAEFVGDEDIYMIGDNETVPFSIEIYDDMAVVMWKQSLGETITLAICEEQEVVKPIDSKFGGTIALYSVNFDKNYLFKDKDGNEKITKAELLPLIENGCNIAIVYMEAGMFRWYSNKVYAYINTMNDSYVEMKVDKNDSDDSLLLFTAEYVGGPQ